jgi:hypothetical protein
VRQPTLRMYSRSVVLPAPRKPESSVTGRRGRDEDEEEEEAAATMTMEENAASEAVMMRGMRSREDNGRRRV